MYWECRTVGHVYNPALAFISLLSESCRWIKYMLFSFGIEYKIVGKSQ